MNRRIKFTHLIGSLAVIEGTVMIDGAHLKFEMAMTESVSGPVDGVLHRSVRLTELDSIEVRRRLFRKSKLIFTASNLSAFEGIPGAKGFTFIALAVTSHKSAVSFVREALFEMAQATMHTLTDRINSQLDE